MSSIHELKPLFKALVMSRGLRSRRVLAGLGLVCVLPLSAQVMAEDVSINIPAQPLPQALQAFGQQTNQQVIYNAADMADLKSTRVSGKMSPQAAIAELLKGTGVRYSLEGNTLMLMRGPATGGLELGATTVKATALDATTEGSQAYTSNAVTIGKGTHTLKEIPQSITVMTRKQMDDQNLVSLKDAVNQTTGIVGLQGVGQGMILSSRGFQIDDWQYDGVPILRNNYSLGNWATQDLIFFDRLEIMRGAAGLLQGTGSPGGAVNLVRKRGQSAPTVTLTGKAGSWDHYGLQLDAGGPLNDAGNIRGRIVADEDQSNSFVDHAWSKTHSLYGALDIDLSEDTTLGFAVSQSNGESRGNIRGLPRYADGSMPDVSRSTYTGARWNRSDIDVTTYYTDLEHRFNEDWAFKVGAVYMTEDNQAKNQRVQRLGGLNPDGTGVQYADFVTDFQSTKSGLDMNLTGKFEALSMEQEVMFGGNFSQLETDDKYARTFNSTSDSIFDLNNDRPDISYEDLINAPLGRGVLSKYDIRQKGVYGTWRVKPVEDLTLVLGSRVSWYDFSYKAKTETSAGITPYSGTTGTETGVVTPYAGIIYDLSREWAVYASYTDIFQPQTEVDTSGSVLKPIVGTNYEVGLKGELMDGRVNTSLAIFRYDHENRAIEDTAGGMLCEGGYCSTASGKVRSQGFDAEISGEVIDNLQLFAGYTYNTTKYLEEPGKDGVVFSSWTPKHMLRVWGNYQLTGDWSRVSTGLGFTTQSHTLVYEEKTHIPGYTVWNARVGYQLTPEIALAVNANNLFDKTYLTSAYNQLDGNNNFGDPRNLMFTVKYTPQF
ncbi:MULTISPECIES: TonB-dependent receptor [unclassified Pseudomonas]|uniref:TonB-dependent siderophore receptor n=1 Tax=unclassified Pseudomonas TaxID=196821 RepID=UPI00089A718F|nr:MULTISPECIES: TonB-dependent receptor [unclassified Pseudomonas]SDY60546.1 outer-membrane receptor for ferric coprogen and ferric-rhodotorulic acid [Pseudomonas sp. NFACC08-1]SEI82845.1 outer-membrane receptor for ferric coprogen and ferric-rhodotorulic acid [Pseudomonas sp. NFACC07-1]